MKFEVHIAGEGPVNATVRLSRRNLVGLLAKLEGRPPQSVCWLQKTEADGSTINVVAEDDDVHYGDRGYPPGAMHPETELAIIGPIEVS